MQGCLISGLLYLFLVKSVQHDDDLTVSVKNHVSLLETIKTVVEFCNHSGSKINITKQNAFCWDL